MGLIVIVSCRGTRWRNGTPTGEEETWRLLRTRRTEMKGERKKNRKCWSFITTLYSSEFIVSSYTSYSHRDLWRGSGTIHELPYLAIFPVFVASLATPPLWWSFIRSRLPLVRDRYDAICAKSTQYCRVLRLILNSPRSRDIFDHGYKKRYDC